MSSCFFASDLHGRAQRYQKLFAQIAREAPAAVFLGGDLLPSHPGVWAGEGVADGGFVHDFLAAGFLRLRESMDRACPRVFLILGNDDSRAEEAAIIEHAHRGTWEYVHQRSAPFGEFEVYGYAYVPPTPFLNKDWERYDVSRHTDPGCVSPEDGYRSVPAPAHAVRHATIRDDLEQLIGDGDPRRAIILFHAPPYQTALDRAALDGRLIDHVPVDVHVGSIAIQRFIEERQPLVTLHGHIHESARLTGAWSQRIGRTCCLSAAHDGPELALVRFDPADPASATRTLI